MLIQTSDSPSGARADMFDYLARAGRSVRSAGDLDSVVRLTARLSVPMLADLTVVVLDGPDGAFRTEVRHRSPAGEARAQEALEGQADALKRAARSLMNDSLKPQWLQSVTKTSLTRIVGSEPGLIEAAKSLGIQSALLYPLNARHHFLGFLLLARTGENHPHDSDDHAAGLIYARRAALALDDATARTAAEAGRRRRSHVDESLAKWAHTFEAATAGAAILDPADWRIESANSSFARMHGYTVRDDLIGRPMIDFVAAEARDDMEARLTGAPDEPHTLETRHLKRDGTSFPVLASFTVMRGPDGRVTYRTVHLHDLSELKRAEERLQGAQRMEAVGRLAGGVAHEVNNMMTIVLGFSEFLLRDPGLASLNREDVAEIQRAAERAAGVSQQLLAFSRRQVLNAAALELSDVVRDATQLLRTLLPADIALETRLEAENAWVRADRNQLDQVLINLAFNARDAMSSGGSLTLETGIRELETAALQERIGIPVPAGTYAVLKVVDTGSGIDAEALTHIFEPFFTTKEVGKGTGLGLATVYGIVKQSGGYITVSSELGRGTAFTVFLPRVPMPAEANRAADAGQIRHGSETVLVVEDEGPVRALVSRALREEGYRTLEASDGAAALRLLAERGHEIDIVVSDVVMPMMGGREMRARLEALGVHIPMLFMSAYTGDEVRQQGLIEAGNAFIQKPFTPGDLTARIRKVLDGRVPPAGRW